MNVKKSVHLALLVTAFSLAGVVSASATPITINNGGFESGTLANPGGFSTINAGNPAIQDWTVVSGSVDWIGAYWQAEGGSARSLDMNGNSVGTIEQDIFVPHAGNVSIDFWMAGNPDDALKIKTMTVRLIAQNQVFTFDATASTHANMGWERRVATFIGIGAGTWTLQFEGDAANVAWGPALDSVSASVPDGGMTAALLGLAMTGLGLVRRMRG